MLDFDQLWKRLEELVDNFVDSCPLLTDEPRKIKGLAQMSGKSAVTQRIRNQQLSVAIGFVAAPSQLDFGMSEFCA